MRGRLRVLVFAAGATAVVMALLATVATGLAPTSGLIDRNPDLPRAVLGDVVARNGISVTLENVEFSGTETVLTLLIQNQLAVDQRDVPLLPVITGTSTRGITSTGEPVFFGAQEVDGKTLRQKVRLGPIRAADEEIAFTISEIQYPGAGLDPIQGPWTFRFVPGVTAVDRASDRVQIERTVESNGIVVDVQDVITSTSGVVIDYALATELPAFSGKENWAARVIFQDGSWVGGHASQGDLSKESGSMQVTFPPLPPGVRRFTVAFGPFLERLPDGIIVDIALPEDREVGGTSPLGKTFTVGGETILVESIQIGKESFTILAQNQNKGERTVVLNTSAPPKVFDDRGNEYQILQLGAHLPDGEGGLTESGKVAITYAGLLDPLARALTIEVPEALRIVPGPDIEISLD